MADPILSLVNDQSAVSASRSQTFARASRHSLFVRVLKFALPTIALAILGGFAFVAVQARSVTNIDVAGVALQNGKIVMDNPKLNGLTGDNQPYTMEAKRALQSPTDINDIELEGITAQIPFGTGITAQVEAPMGHLDNGKQVLRLEGGFDLIASDGMVAKLQDAIVDFGGGSLQTAMPVDIKRPGMHIQADSMTITDGGASLVFENRVRMTLQPDAIKQPKEPNNGG